jgi:hypothetical protein
MSGLEVQLLHSIQGYKRLPVLKTRNTIVEGITSAIVFRFSSITPTGYIFISCNPPATVLNALQAREIGI